MSKDLNDVNVIGRLTKDIELRYTQSGMAMAKMSIAVNDSSGSGESKKDYVNFFDVTIWDKQAINCEKYLKKGSQVAVEGSLKQSRWEKDGQKHSKVEITASSVQFLDTRAKESNSINPQINDMPNDPWQS